MEDIEFSNLPYLPDNCPPEIYSGFIHNIHGLTNNQIIGKEEQQKIILDDLGVKKKKPETLQDLYESYKSSKNKLYKYLKDAIRLYFAIYCEEKLDETYYISEINSEYVHIKFIGKPYNDNYTYSINIYDLSGDYKDRLLKKVGWEESELDKYLIRLEKKRGIPYDNKTSE